jgi:hypothetical protein
MLISIIEASLTTSCTPSLKRNSLNARAAEQGPSFPPFTRSLLKFARSVKWAFFGFRGQSLEVEEVSA